MQAGAAGDRKRHAAVAGKLGPAVEPKNLVNDPKKEQAVFGPPAALHAAIAAGDQATFDKAWKDAGAAWKKRYGRPAEKANMDALLDLEAVGIGRIAGRFGLKAPATNPYAPADLIALP